MTDTQTTAPVCSCLSVHHALTLADRARVATALFVAQEQGNTDYAGYLAQQLESCTTSGRLRVVQRPRPARISRRKWHFGGTR